MKKISILILSVFFAIQLNAQTGVSISDDNTNPHASAQLDVKSITKGILIPRMTQTQRNAIVSPATGLLIYQTDNTAGFYFWNSTAWVAVGGAGGGDMLKSENLSGLANYTTARTNLGLGNVENTALSTWIGSSNITTLGTIGTGTWNGTAINATYIGNLDAAKITSGTFDNARINWAAPGAIGSTTAASGKFSTLNINGNYNLPTTDGTNGQVLQTNGSGAISWATPAGGSDNLGNHTATANIQLSGNYLSNDGGNEGISVDNSGNVTSSGTMTVGAYTLPATDGTSGQVLQTNGSGTVSWATPSGGGSSLTVLVTSGDATLTTANTLIRFTGTHTITLPASPALGQIVYIYGYGHGGATIGKNGKSTHQEGAIYPGDETITAFGHNTFTLIWDGTYWVVVEK